VNPKYSFLASDGNTYEGDLNELRHWVSDGRILLDNFVIDAATGKDLVLRDLLYPVVGSVESRHQALPDSPVGVAGAYPRGYQGSAMGPEAPTTIGNFNWGAFCFTWIWGLNHRKPFALLALVLYFLCFPIFLVFAIWIGTQGNLWAWESGRFATAQDCVDCQAIWGKWALGCFLVTFTIIAMVAICFVIAPFIADPGMRNNLK
jgi:hypothetical protein